MLYRTGDESGLTEPDNGEVFGGLRSEATQTAIRKSEGVLEKGQVWTQMTQEAEAELQELRPTEPQ